jgi:hypothetical protein
VLGFPSPQHLVNVRRAVLKYEVIVGLGIAQAIVHPAVAVIAEKALCCIRVEYLLGAPLPTSKAQVLETLKHRKLPRHRLERALSGRCELLV